MLTRVSSTLSAEIEKVMEETIGCALEVHKALGAGYLEAVYHKALRAELKHQQIRFKSEHLIHLTYRGEILHGHRIDLMVEDVVIVEVKAVERLERIHQSQVASYLKAAGLRAGLLINFNTEWLKNGIRRVVL